MHTCVRGCEFILMNIEYGMSIVKSSKNDRLAMNKKMYHDVHFAAYKRESIALHANEEP